MQNQSEIIIAAGTVWVVQQIGGLWHACEPAKWTDARWFVVGRCDRIAVLRQLDRVEPRTVASLDRPLPADGHYLIYTEFMPYFSSRGITCFEFMTQGLLTGFARHLLRQGYPMELAVDVMETIVRIWSGPVTDGKGIPVPRYERSPLTYYDRSQGLN